MRPPQSEGGEGGRRERGAGLGLGVREEDRGHWGECPGNGAFVGALGSHILSKIRLPRDRLIGCRRCDPVQPSSSSNVNLGLGLDLGSHSRACRRRSRGFPYPDRRSPHGIVWTVPAGGSDLGIPPRLAGARGTILAASYRPPVS